MALIDSLKFIEVIRDDANALTAVPEHVLDTAMFIGKAKKIEQGRIPTLPVYTGVILYAGEKHTIAFGYNKKEYVISCASLEDQTSATALATDLLINKTAWVNGVLINGAMANNGSYNQTIQAGESSNIPKGYHDGNGHITAATLASQTGGTAGASHILIGKIAWVNGAEIVGTMPDNVAKTLTIQAGESYTIPEGYHAGAGKVVAATLASQTGGTAVAGDILNNKTAWVGGVLITGTIPKIASQEISIPVNGSYTIPSGFHAGLGKVKNTTPVISSLTITPSFEAQTIETKGKYFTQNITVSALNALNYNLFDSKHEIFGTYNVADVLNKPSTDVLALPVDNWHDNATSNIYSIDANIAISSQGKDINISGCIFSNNLIADKVNTNVFTIYDDGTITIKLVHSLDPNTNAHKFTLSSAIKEGSPSTPQVDIILTIKEVAQFRKYGDVHDKEYIFATGRVINPLLNNSLTIFKKASIAPDPIPHMLPTGVQPEDPLHRVDISERQDGSIVSWYDATTTTQYWWCDAPNAYLNPDSSYLFSDFGNLITFDTTGLSASKMKNMHGMFLRASSMRIAPSFDTTSSVTNMEGVFDMGSNSGGSSVLDDISALSTWDVSNVTNMVNMFRFTTVGNLKPLTNWEVSKVIDFGGMFDSCSLLVDTLPLNSWNTISATNMESMFQGTKIEQFPTFDMSNVTDTQFMCNECKKLQHVPKLNTPKLENCQFMFFGCSDPALTTIPQFDTSSVTNMAAFLNSTRFTGTWEIQHDGDVNVSNLFTGTINPITMKYKASNTRAVNYVAPTNVTKEVIP